MRKVLWRRKEDIETENNSEREMEDRLDTSPSATHSVLKCKPNPKYI